MPLQVSCPSCQKRYQVADTLAGTKAKCQACGQAMAIPLLKSKVELKPEPQSAGRLQVTCNGCGKKHGVAASMAGKAARCSCGAVVQVPGKQMPVSAPDFAPDPFEADPFSDHDPFAEEASAAAYSPGLAKRSGKPSRGFPVATAAIGVGVVMVLGLLAIVVMSFLGEDTEPEVAMARQAPAEDAPAELKSPTASVGEGGATVAPPPGEAGSAFPQGTASRPVPPSATSQPARVGGGARVEGGFSASGDEASEDSSAANSPPVHSAEVQQEINSRTLFSMSVSAAYPFVVTDQSRMFAIGNHIYQGDPPAIAGVLPAPSDQSARNFILSSDGKWLAHFQNGPHWQSIQTGEKQHFPFNTSAFSARTYNTILYFFRGNDELVWVGEITTDPVCMFFSLDSPKPKAQFTLDVMGQAGAAVHPDGKHIAVADVDEIAIYDLDQKQQVGILPMGGAVRDFSFSPDGKQMAVILKIKNKVGLMVVDANGREIYQAPLPPSFQRMSRGAAPLQWLPDGSGWLLHYKYLLDRKSKLIVWEVDPKSLVASTVRLEEEGTFSAVARTGGGYRYVKRRFPREAIEKATAEYIAAGPLVRPKRRISLTFDIKNVLDGTAEKLIEEYRQMWKSKFYAIEATLADDGDYVMSIVHSERLAPPVKAQKNVDGKTIVNYDVNQVLFTADITITDPAGNVIWNEHFDTRKVSGFGMVRELPDIAMQRKGLITGPFFSSIRSRTLPAQITGERPTALPVYER